MSGLKKTTKKNLMVFSGRAHPELAEEVAVELGTRLVPTSAYEFANSELYVRFEESVRGAEVFLLQPTCPPIDQNLLETLILVDALKRASADRITCVLPYYGYGAGVLRVSLGDNWESGGSNSSSLEAWFYITDATVTAGDTAIVQRGRLTLR